MAEIYRLRTKCEKSMAEAKANVFLFGALVLRLFFINYIYKKERGK